MCKKLVFMILILSPSCMPRCSTVFLVQFIRMLLGFVPALTEGSVIHLSALDAGMTCQNQVKHLALLVQLLLVPENPQHVLLYCHELFCFGSAMVPIAFYP